MNTQIDQLPAVRAYVEARLRTVRNSAVKLDAAGELEGVLTLIDGLQKVNEFFRQAMDTNATTNQRGPVPF